MSVKKYLAFFERHATLPDNHTFTNLIDAAHRIKPLPATLISDSKSLETLQDICPIFEDYQKCEPEAGQLDKMYAVAAQVIEYCLPEN